MTPSATNDNGTTPVSTLVSATTTVKSVPEAAYKGSTKLQRQSSKEIPNKVVDFFMCDCLVYMFIIS